MVGSGEKSCIEARRAESGCVFLERGQPAHTQPARGLPSGVWGIATAEIELGAF